MYPALTNVASPPCACMCLVLCVHPVTLTVRRCKHDLCYVTCTSPLRAGRLSWSTPDVTPSHAHSTVHAAIHAYTHCKLAHHPEPHLTLSTSLTTVLVVTRCDLTVTRGVTFQAGMCKARCDLYHAGRTPMWLQSVIAATSSSSLLLGAGLLEPPLRGWSAG